jgi:hypothetical protein
MKKTPTTPETVIAIGVLPDGQPWRHYTDSNAIEWLDVAGTLLCREDDESGFVDSLAELQS